MATTSTSTLDSIIEAAADLPPAPQILPKLSKTIADINSGLDDIVDLLKLDAQLTANIVRISNSAAYGGGGQSQSIEDAINRLGFREVYHVVATAISRQLLNCDMPAYNLKPGELMSFSVACGLLMKNFCITLGIKETDAAYTVGLLHNIGKLIINQHYIKQGLEFYTKEQTEELFPGLEQQMFGFDNVFAAATLLKAWNFPDDVITPIEYQNTPLEKEEHSQISCMLSIAMSIEVELLDIEDFDKIHYSNVGVLEKSGLTIENIRSCAVNAKADLEELLRSIG